MSYDIFVQDLPAGIRSVDEIPDGFVPQPLGPRGRIIAAIKDVAPDASFPEPAWGSIESPDYSIDINLGEEDVVRGFAFHVRGGDEALLVVAAILNSMNLRALAPGTASGLFTADEAMRAFAAWRAHRSRVADA